MSRRRRSGSVYKRRREKKAGVGFFLTAFAVVAIISLVLASMIVFFKVSIIQVSGDSRYTQENIIAASEISTGGNLFLINKFEAIGKIFSALPYLDEVSIKRTLPDTLTIHVSDCVPRAVILSLEGGGYVIDSKGKLLEEISDGVYDELCGIKGIELSDPQVGKYIVFTEPEKENATFLLLNSMIDNDILEDVGEIDLSTGYDISIRYLDRFTVKLGNSENMEKKIRYLRVIVEDNLSPMDRGIIDVSDGVTASFRAE